MGCHKIIVMSAGHVIEIGSPTDLIEGISGCGAFKALADDH